MTLILHLEAFGVGRCSQGIKSMSKIPDIKRGESKIGFRQPHDHVDLLYSAMITSHPNFILPQVQKLTPAVQPFQVVPIIQHNLPPDPAKPSDSQSSGSQNSP